MHQDVHASEIRVSIPLFSMAKSQEMFRLNYFNFSQFIGEMFAINSEGKNKQLNGIAYTSRKYRDG